MALMGCLSSNSHALEPIAFPKTISSKIQFGKHWPEAGCYELRKLAAAKANEAHAQAQVEAAKRNLELTRALLEAAEKAASPPKPQPIAEGKDDAWITIHIRPQLVGEKVLKLRPEEYIQTVLTGIANADKEITIKPDTVTMWLVRDKKVLPIDLTAIFLKGNNSTNYQLRGGDKLFIQFKAEK
jgi:hypothetical protein